MAEIKEMEKSLQFAHGEIEKLKSALDQFCLNSAQMERRLTRVEAENRELKAYAEELEDLILNLDSATRKRNFVITGLAESNDERSDSLILLVYNYLQTFVETLDISDFDCAYRLGKRSNKTRPILCKLVKESVRNDICSVRNSLNDEDSETKVYLNDDLPQLMIERKAVFRTVVKLAKSQKIPASSTNTKVTVNNITYSHRNLDCLPEGCRLEDARTIKVKGGYAFQSEYSWLSNFFPCTIEIEDQRFTSAEQAYQFTKASRLGDTNLAKMIMRCKNAKEAKKKGSGHEINPKWDAQKIDVMRTIAREKFMQNPELCDKLVQTGQASLIEATLDSFWAANATLNSKSLKKGTWEGANFMGKILMEVRTELRRELGLTDEPMNEESNTTSDEIADTGSEPPLPTDHGSADGNTNKGKTYAAVSASTKSGKPAKQPRNPNQNQNLHHNQNQTPGRGKKNKGHQSPILSPTSKNNQRSTGQQEKKVRVYSPSSSLPPKNPRAGSLFSASPIKCTTEATVV